MLCFVRYVVVLLIECIMDYVPAMCRVVCIAVML